MVIAFIHEVDEATLSRIERGNAHILAVYQALALCHEEDMPSERDHSNVEELRQAMCSTVILRTSERRITWLEYHFKEQKAQLEEAYADGRRLVEEKERILPLRNGELHRA